MNIKYDSVADAMYMKVSSGKVAKTLKMQDRLIVDVDENGGVVGIEILDASSQKGFIKSLEKSVLSGVPVSMTNSTPITAA